MDEIIEIPTMLLNAFEEILSILYKAEICHITGSEIKK